MNTLLFGGGLCLKSMLRHIRLQKDRVDKYSGGIEHTTSGEYIFEGMEISGMNPGRLAVFRIKSIGFVFQVYRLSDGLRTADNEELPLGDEGMKRSGRKRKSVEALNKLDLLQYATRVCKMSDGRLA